MAPGKSNPECGCRPCRLEFWGLGGPYIRDLIPTSPPPIQRPINPPGPEYRFESDDEDDLPPLEPFDPTD